MPIIRKVRANVPLGLNYVSLFGPKATTKFLAEQVPGLYIATVKPRKRLPEVLETITVASFDVFIVTHANAANDTVATIAQLMHENFKALAKRHPLLRTLGDEPISAPTNPIPYHAAAVSYFKEQNLWGADNDQAEARFKK